MFGPSSGDSGIEISLREAQDAQEARQAQDRPKRSKAASGPPDGDSSKFREPMGGSQSEVFLITILGAEMT